MSELKGSKTEQNLQAAFAGESQANRKYTYYAAAARKAGLKMKLLTTLKKQLLTKAHAKIWFKLLQEIGDVNADVTVNLKDAAAGEHYENTTVYPLPATAKKETSLRFAYLFEQVGYRKTPRRTLQRSSFLRKRRQSIQTPTAPVRQGSPANCGYIHVGTEAPQVCPVCGHPQAFFSQHGKPPL